MSITLEDIKKMQRTLDDAAVPSEDRYWRFLGIDGEIYEIRMDTPPDEATRKALKDKFPNLFDYP